MTQSTRRLSLFRVLGWGTLAVLLALPAILRFPWSGTDFVIMGIMLASVGLGIEFLVQRSGSIAFRMGAVIAVLTAFLTIWANLAIGMIGSEENPYNQLFMVVPLVTFVAGAVARFEPRRMFWILLAASIVQLGLALGGAGVDARGARFSSIFAGAWLLSAALFRAAAVGPRASTR